MIYNGFYREISCHCITASQHHCITTSLCHCITAPPHHHVTTLVSHLPCPLPPNQSVIHLPCPLPPNQSVICLAACHQTTWGDLRRPPVETTHGDHLWRPMETCGDHPQRPTETTCRDPQRPLVETCRDHPQRPVETTLVSHLPYPLPPNQSVIHLPCPLPPNQSVICLAPCHQATHGDPRRPPAETTRGDHLWKPMETCGEHPWRPTETTCRDPWRPTETTRGDLQRPPTETCGDYISQSFALPPATKPVSHLFALPLPPNQSVICLAPCHQTTHRDLQRPAETTHRDHLQRPLMETCRDHPQRPVETLNDQRRKRMQIIK